MQKISNYIAVIFFLFIYCCSHAQYKITFLVKQPSLQHKADPVFIAGSFNSWDPGNGEFQIDSAKQGITLLLSTGDYEYKFTRGNWQKGECTATGQGVPNRFIKVSGDTIINIAVQGWSDDFDQGVPAKISHSASPNVSVMDTAFFIPELNRKRRIWIYLPPGYETSRNHYPVLYMHDGQNLFDNATSYSGEWGVDEYLDAISSSGKKEAIVVGIDNGLAKRMNEYNPFFFRQAGKGEGNEYVEFLVKYLKPFIDKHYKTLPGKENTFIAGSSMGGLISLYAVVKYPSVFGGAGIFSPALSTAPAMDSLVRANAKAINSKLFFYAGGEEGDSMVPDMKKIESEFKAASRSTLDEIIDPAAKHNETAWRKYFPAFYDWAIAGGTK